MLLATERTTLLLVARAARLAGRFRDRIPVALLLSLSGESQSDRGRVGFLPLLSLRSPADLELKSTGQIHCDRTQSAGHAPSYHLRMRFIVMEDVEDFATAWSLQEARARGERIPKHCLDPHLLLYREVAKFRGADRASLSARRTRPLPRPSPRRLRARPTRGVQTSAGVHWGR